MNGSNNTTEIETNWERITSNISNLKLSYPIQVIAVTKHQPIDKIIKSLELGISQLGVNYVQQGALDRAQLTSFNPKWHFLGSIQSRKVKFLTDYDCIQSLDRIEIAADLNARLEKLQKALYVMVEVNIGREVQKSGVLPEKLPTFLEALTQFPNLKLNGLMCLPPALYPVEDRKQFFEKMKALYDQHAEVYSFEWLSMGTSEDYLIALRAGSNMVRLGTSLYGSRAV